MLGNICHSSIRNTARALRPSAAAQGLLPLICIHFIARRSNQISTELKTELNRKLADFSSPTDTMEETFENREQIEISRYYERLPKPVIIATEEFLDGELFYKENKPQA